MSPHKFCYRISFTVQVNSTRGAVLILQVFGTENTISAIHFKSYYQSKIYYIFRHVFILSLYIHTFMKKMLRRTLFSLKKDYQ